MGYYTYYYMNIEPDPNRNQTKLSEEIQKRLDAEVAKMHVFEEGDSTSGWSGYAKWYDHDQDMLMLSHRFPEVLFTLYGDGEETEDFWYAYYLNGYSQDAPVRFEYDKFDMSKLIETNDQSLFAPDRKYSYES